VSSFYNPASGNTEDIILETWEFRVLENAERRLFCQVCVKYILSCSDYCDDYDVASPLPTGQVLTITSDAASKRFETSTGEFGSGGGGARSLEINVDRDKTYQTILGWGGAFTDSAGINIAKLSPDAQDAVIR
jgi:hypothetical protein